MNDERLGLAIGNFANEMTALYVTDQPASLQFSDLANVYGLGAPTQPPLKFGLFFFDYDLDGRLDLLSANGHLEPDISKVQASETYEQPAQLFWNIGQGRTRPLRSRSARRPPGPTSSSRSSAAAAPTPISTATATSTSSITVNNGPARLFRNDGGNANHWIRLALRATARHRTATPSAPRSRSSVGDQVCRRQLFPAKSYLSSVELPLTFGLGKAEKVDEITITWPSGKVTELKDLKPDRVYTIDEDAGVRS